jgi:hypothetical protein
MEKDNRLILNTCLEELCIPSEAKKQIYETVLSKISLFPVQRGKRKFWCILGALYLGCIKAKHPKPLVYFRRKFEMSLPSFDLLIRRYSFFSKHERTSTFEQQLRSVKQELEESSKLTRLFEFGLAGLRIGDTEENLDSLSEAFDNFAFIRTKAFHEDECFLFFMACLLVWAKAQKLEHPILTFWGAFFNPVYLNRVREGLSKLSALTLAKK